MPKRMLVGRQGKVRAGQPDSVVCPIVAESDPRLWFKLRLSSALSEGAYDKAVAVFPSFMKDVHGESLAGSMVSKRPSARILSGTVLLVYDRSVAALRVVDPLLRAAGQTQPVIQHERPAAILRFVEILCAVRRLSSTLGDQRRSSGFSSADNHRRHDRQTKHPQRP